MHEPAADNAPSSGPSGSVELGLDGSMAALVPARRAMSWQLTDPSGTPVVNERYWVSFQPGEIRTCASCHGQNEVDQANQPPPTNSPQALRTLLQHLKAQGHL
jgi:cytochrome c553